ncbi:MAG: hypothetical protein WBL93_07760 [Lutisporaceae bacterium]
MEGFKLEGKNGHISIEFLEVYGFPNNTSVFGGYDAKGIVEIKSSNYRVCGELWFSTGEIYNFYSTLKECNKRLDGKAELITTETNLKMSVDFDKIGHVVISGEYVERYDENNELTYEIFSDQSYIQDTIKELNEIVNKYGGLQGKK